MSIYVDNKRLITEDDLQSGQTNLWRNTADFSGNKWVSQGSPKENGTAPNGNVAYRTKAWSQIYQQPISSLKVGEIYTLSANINPVNDKTKVFAYLQTSSGGTLDDYYSCENPVTMNKGWQRHAFIFTILKNYDSDLRFFISQNNEVDIANIKFQRGSLFTDWSPAPEDFLDEIKALKNQIGGVANPCYITTYSEYATPLKEVA